MSRFTNPAKIQVPKGWPTCVRSAPCCTDVVNRTSSPSFYQILRVGQLPVVQVHVPLGRADI